MRALLWFIVIINSGLYICTAVKDPDLWWHITVGRWIVANRTVPVVDYWTMFGSGQPWRAYSWPVEILFAAIEAWWGAYGLLVLQMFFGIALAAFVCWGLSRIAADYFFGTLIGVYATVATFSHFTLRPQVLVWIYFILLIVTADTVERRGLTTKLKLTFLGIMCLWANTHISSALGIVAVGAWLYGTRPLKEVVAAVACCLAGTLITPYLGGEWGMFFQTVSHPFSFQSVYEFKPANIAQFVTGFLVLELAVLAAFFHKNPRLFDLPKLLLTGLFVIGGLTVIKFMPFALIVVTAVLALFWRRAHQSGVTDDLLTGFDHLRTVFTKINGWGLVFLLGVLAVVRADALWAVPIDRVVTPVAAVDFLLQKRLPFPVLNPFGSGGYLMYRLSDSKGNVSHKVAIDGRTNIISEELWGSFYVALNGRIGWQRFIEKVQPNTILWKWESPLTPILQEGGKWCLLFHSGIPTEGFVVFVRREYMESHQAEYADLHCR
jgi:hypothetical protein